MASNEYKYGSDGSADSDEDVEVYNTKYETFRCATVVIIDNSKSMFDLTDEEGTSKFKLCLQSCLSTLEKFLFKRFFQNIAIILMAKKNEDAIINFDDNLISSISKLDELTRKSNIELKDQFCTDTVNMSDVYDALHESGAIFKRSQRLFKRCRCHVAIATCNSKPSGYVKEEEMETAKDELKGLQIQPVVLPLVDGFQWDLFYGDMVTGDTEVVGELDNEGYDTAEALSSVLDQLAQTRVNISRSVFRYSDDSCFPVQVKTFFHVKKLYHNVQVTRSDETVVKRQDNEEGINPVISEETDENKPTVFIQAGIDSKTLEQRSVGLTKNEYDFMTSHPVTVGLYLLYVCEGRSSLHHLRKQCFLVQEDEVLAADDPCDALFHYFWEHCSDRSKVLVCTYLPNNNKRKTYLVELRPTRYAGKPCFIGRYLSNGHEIKKYAPQHRGRSGKSSVFSKDLSTAQALVEQLTIDSERALSLPDPEYESKADVVKGALLALAGCRWQPPDPEPQFPSASDVTERIGQKLSDRFRQEHLTGIMKRKRAK